MNHIKAKNLRHYECSDCGLILTFGNAAGEDECKCPVCGSAIPLTEDNELEIYDYE